MQLSEIRLSKLKGLYLRKPSTPEDGILKVKSSTNNAIVLIGITKPNYITYLPSVFENKRHLFEIVRDEEITELMEERYHCFLEDNYEVIRAMANSPKYAIWGGNGYPMAESHLLEELKGVNCIDMEYVNADKVKKEYLSDL